MTAGGRAPVSRAVEIAKSQSAKSLELRAATSLARYLQDQGKSAEAREALEPVYGWFTEGFDEGPHGREGAARRAVLTAEVAAFELDYVALLG